MSGLWFTADLHIGHPMVAEIRGYGVTDQHDRVLAERWDAAIQPNDIVWVLGDLAVGGTEATARALNWIADRPGTKHLIAGNHDPVHPMHRDAHRWQAAYLNVFASVQPFARRRISGRNVLLSHFPYVGDHTVRMRYDQYRLRDCGELLLHGHTHSDIRWHSCAPRQIHVGVDAWQLAPASLAEVERIIEEADQ